MLSGRRSPCRRQGLIGGLVGDVVDHSRQRQEDDANRRHLALQCEHKRTIERQLDHESLRSIGGVQRHPTLHEPELNLPSYGEAVQAPPGTPSIDEAAAPPKSETRVQIPQNHLLVPPDRCSVGPTVTRPRSAQACYGPSASWNDEPTSPQSYLRDPRSMDSFLHDPYSRGLSFFGPGEPTSVVQRQQISASSGMPGVGAERGCGGRYMHDTNDEPHHGRRSGGGRQSLLGTLIGAAVKSGLDSHHQKRQRPVSVGPSTSRGI